MLGRLHTSFIFRRLALIMISRTDGKDNDEKSVTSEVRHTALDYDGRSSRVCDGSQVDLGEGSILVRCRGRKGTHTVKLTVFVGCI